ncbi:MAG: 5'-nucleotidase [Gammaproteobacteria bacterium]
MQERFSGNLVVAISSRALFDLNESHHVYEEQGLEAYCQYQIDHENDILEKGVAFDLVRKLLKLNDGNPEHTQVEVILLSRNSADSGLRIFNSIEHYNLDITRAAFTNGQRPYTYVSAFGAHLFLSSNADDVGLALEDGYAAATILPGAASRVGHKDQLRIAFDGDAVVFSDEAERIYQERGLDAFSEAEILDAEKPLSGGPFKKFLLALHSIQQQFPPDNSPIRTALVTSRGAPAHKRVILTLRKWGVRVDEALFLGGLSKGAFLKSFGADIFFDDQRSHCEGASEHVTAAHVPHGIANALRAVPDKKAVPK